jgi:hypothetical protein
VSREAAGGRSGRKKSGEELAQEVLSHFVATAHNFYTSLAKAIHTPLRWGRALLIAQSCRFGPA